VSAGAVLGPVIGAVVGAGTGALVPRLIARLPEPAADPTERAGDFPDKIPYAEVAAGPRLALRCALACLVAGASIGLSTGWSWGLPWLLYLVPLGCALAVVDWHTWYLPKVLVAPSYAVVGALVLVAAVAAGDWRVARDAVIGWAVLGAYYGLLWFVSPRIMAYGDVRLGGLLGLALGPFGLLDVLSSVFAAAVLGAAALLPMRSSGRTIRRHAPYGPFLVLGALAALVLGSLLDGTFGQGTFA